MNVEKLNFKFNIDELRDYYSSLQQDYQDYIWRVKTLTDKDEYTAKRVASAIDNYGWAITTEVLDENIKSNPPWPEVLSEFSYAEKELKTERITPLAFGVIDRLLKKIPYAHHVIMSVFPPGSATIPHSDQDFLLRIHVPIYTNKNVKWLTDEGYSQMHEVGYAYLCDTRIMHAAYNDDSKEDRVHLIFAIEDKYINDIKSVTGIL
jgi:hypothetical protein